MARTDNRQQRLISRKDGAQEYVKMTPRQERFFDILNESLGFPVMIEEIKAKMDINIENLRVTKQQVKKLVEGYYVIESKWGRSYTMYQM